MKTTVTAVIIAFLLGTGAGHAQSRIVQSGWEGFANVKADGKFDYCVLYNRTIDALNDSPYGMIGMTRNAAGGVGMLVFYQPRALKRGNKVPVLLKIDQYLARVTGDVLSDFHIRIEGPLDATTVAALRRATSVEVMTQGHAAKFAVRQVGAVLNALAACVKAHEP